jgi:hypothetical protein
LARFNIIHKGRSIWRGVTCLRRVMVLYLDPVGKDLPGCLAAFEL